MRKLLCVLALVIALPTGAWAQAPIKMGGAFGLTGYLAVLDTAIMEGAQLAVERINSTGGLLNGRKITFLVEENKSQPSSMVTAFRKLSEQDQISVLVAGCSSAATHAIAPTQARQKIPSVVCATLPPPEDQAGRQWVFTTLPNLQFDISQRFGYLRGLNVTRVGMIMDTTPYGAIQRKVAEASAKDFNITIVGIEQYRPEDSDLTPQLTKLRATNLQALMQLGSGAATGIIAKAMDDLGMTVPFVADLSVNPTEVYKVAGAASNKVVFPAFPPTVYEAVPDTDPRKAAGQEFMRMWRAKYGAERDATWGGRGWDAVMLLAEGIKRAGSADGDKVRAALDTLKDFVGTCSLYTFEPTNHDGVRQSPFFMARMENGRVSMIKK
jgi:ABC-type branched-subunit amino acid transport system substrate-binding protein